MKWLDTVTINDIQRHLTLSHKMTEYTVKIEKLKIYNNARIYNTYNTLTWTWEIWTQSVVAMYKPTSTHCQHALSRVNTDSVNTLCHVSTLTLSTRSVTCQHRQCQHTVSRVNTDTVNTLSRVNTLCHVSTLTVSTRSVTCQHWHCQHTLSRVNTDTVNTLCHVF